MKLWNKTTLSLLVLILLSLSLISLFDTDPEVSGIEKRALKKKPEFSFQALWGNTYMRELGEYYADTFPFRETFMSINTALNRLYFFNAGQNNELVIEHTGGGAEGGESLDFSPGEPEESESGAAEPSLPGGTGGDTEALPSPVESVPAATEPPDPELQNPDASEAVRAGASIIIIGDRAMEIPYTEHKIMDSYAEAVNLFKEKMPETRVFSLVAPNGGEFYSPESMHTGSSSQKDMISYVYERLNGVIQVDAYSKIRKNIDKYVFFRTDHHWTQLGAYYAYTAFCEAAGFDAVSLDAFESGRYENFVGSMYGFTSKYPQSKALKDNPDYLDYYLPAVNCEAEYFDNFDLENGKRMSVVNERIPESYGNKYLCFISGDTPVCRIKTDAGTGKKIIVIKESYGNAFVPFLTSHYDEIYVIDPRKWNGKGQPEFNMPEFAARHEIDDVLALNYPFIITNSAFIRMMKNLCP